VRVVLHRVDRAVARLEGEMVASIGAGLVVLAGFGREDAPGVVRRLAGKIVRLRIFEHGGSMFGAGIQEVGGEILTLSQFPLAADTSRGSKPNFSRAAGPDAARGLYVLLDEALADAGAPVVVQAPFGSHLAVDMSHRGPFTVVLEG